MTAPDARPTAPATEEVSPLDDWQALQRLIDAALDRPCDTRAAYLDAACGTDAALRERAGRLLGACERAEGEDGLLATPALAFAAPLVGSYDAPAEELREALAGRYVIEREIGRGGTSTVYLARDVRHERPVALKVLAPALGAALSAERFLREIRVTAALQHPHVLPLFDSGEAAGRLYYVMPYVEGQSLRERLRRERQLPIEEAIRIANWATAHRCSHNRRWSRKVAHEQLRRGEKENAPHQVN